MSLFAALAATGAVRAQCTYSWPAAAFGAGCDDTVTAATIDQNGDLVVGGRFSDAGGTAANRIARFDGSAWSALGTGMDAEVAALTTLPSGDLVAGGIFTTAGGVTTNCVARWNGTAWSAFGSGVDGITPFGCSVQALAVLPGGDLVVGGFFQTAGGVTVNNIARWNGATWTPLGFGVNGIVRDLLVLANGDLIAAGNFVTASGVTVNGIARYNGTNWSALGTGLSLLLAGATSLAELPNGDIVVGGSFLTAGGAPANRIARYNGASWGALGAGMNGPVTSLSTLPSGDLLAGGIFTGAGGVLVNRIARWNGSAWSGFGAGVDAGVQDMVSSPDGSVVVVGDFTVVPGSAAGRVARIVSSCAPQVSVIGTGCTGAGGLNVLAASQLPSIGGSFAAIGTGLPPLGFVLAVTGLTSISLPLSVALPQALPGCTAYAPPDLIDVLLPVAGQASSSFGLPNTPSLVGLTFVQQYVTIELNAMFNITAATSSNALQLTIGTF